MPSIILRGAISRPGIGTEEGLGSRGVQSAEPGKVVLIGRTQRGSTTKPIRCRTFEEYQAKAGQDLWNPFTSSFDDYTPDQIRGYFEGSGNRGEVIVRRLEGADAVKASIVFRNRADGDDSLTLRAKNPGAWGGRLVLSVSPGTMTIAADTLMTVGAATWVTNQYRGATVTNVTRSTSHVVQSNTGTALSFAADASLVTTDGWLTGDTYTIELLHNDQHLSARIEPSRFGADFFKLLLFVNGSQVKEYARVTMDPDSDYYVVSILDDDTSNYYAEAVDTWAAGGNSYATVGTDSNPASFAGTTSALAATVLTDSTEVFPTVATHGYDLSTHGPAYVRDPGTFTTSLIVSNTATTVTVVDSDDLTSILGSHPQAYELIATTRCAGGIDDHSGVVNSDYINEVTADTTVLDGITGIGSASLYIPGMSAFSAANRQALHNAAIAYAETRGWVLRVEAPSNLTSTAAKTLVNLASDADLYFLDTSTNLAIDSIWASIFATSWQRVRYPDHGNRIEVVPLIGDLLGVEAGVAITSGGYIIPAAGPRSEVALPRAISIDWDFEGQPIERAMDRYSERLNFFVERGGKFYAFGVRTPQSTFPAWVYLTQRRQMSHVVDALQTSPAIEQLLFLPNNAANRAEFAGIIRGFLRSEYDAGRLDQDLGFDEAAVVNAGVEVNTAAVRATGMMVADVVLAFPYPAEKIRLRMSKNEASLSLAG